MPRKIAKNRLKFLRNLGGFCLMLTAGTVVNGAADDMIDGATEGNKYGP